MTGGLTTVFGVRSFTRSSITWFFTVSGGLVRSSSCSFWVYLTELLKRIACLWWAQFLMTTRDVSSYCTWLIHALSRTTSEVFSALEIALKETHRVCAHVSDVKRLNNHTHFGPLSEDGIRC